MKMMYMPRDYMLVAGSGHSFQFKANEPQAVPDVAVDDVIKIGGVFYNKEEQKILVDEPPSIEVPAMGFAREQKIFDACVELINKNSNEAFTPGGKPKLDAVKEIVGFDVDRKEVNDVFSKAMQAQANAT